LSRYAGRFPEMRLSRDADVGALQQPIIGLIMICVGILQLSLSLDASLGMGDHANHLSVTSPCEREINLRRIRNIQSSVPIPCLLEIPHFRVCWRQMIARRHKVDHDGVCVIVLLASGRLTEI
jgi:hypothetical protein